MSDYVAPERRKVRVAEQIAHHAAAFLARESNRSSLITVMRAEINPELKNVTVFVSVLPKEQGPTALAFLKRVRTDFHDYLKDKTVFRNVPTVDFELDLGEENRQRIEELTRKNK